MTGPGRAVQRTDWFLAGEWFDLRNSGEQPKRPDEDGNPEQAPGARIADRLSELARSLQTEHDEDGVLRHMVEAAIGLIPGVEEASISLVVGRERVQSRMPSSRLPEQVDEVQNQTGQGPCLDAVYEHRTVRVPDMAAEDRWPDFARRAADLGVGSMLSFQLFVDKGNLGALNLYSRQAGAFSEDSERIGTLVAANAAVAFADIRKINYLYDAARVRDELGQAKGMLMDRYGISSHHAFVLLARVSASAGLGIEEAAHELVISGDLPQQSEDAAGPG